MAKFGLLVFLSGAPGPPHSLRTRNIKALSTHIPDAPWVPLTKAFAQNQHGMNRDSIVVHGKCAGACKPVSLKGLRDTAFCLQNLPVQRLHLIANVQSGGGGRAMGERVFRLRDGRGEKEKEKNMESVIVQGKHKKGRERMEGRNEGGEIKAHNEKESGQETNLGTKENVTSRTQVAGASSDEVAPAVASFVAASVLSLAVTSWTFSCVGTSWSWKNRRRRGRVRVSVRGNWRWDRPWSESVGWSLTGSSGWAWWTSWNTRRSQRTAGGGSSARRWPWRVCAWSRRTRSEAVGTWVRSWMRWCRWRVSFPTGAFAEPKLYVSEEWSHYWTRGGRARVEEEADLWCSGCTLRAAELLTGNRVPVECGESLTATPTSGRWERVREWHGRVAGEGNAFYNARGGFCAHVWGHRESSRAARKAGTVQRVGLRSYYAEFRENLSLVAKHQMIPHRVWRKCFKRTTNKLDSIAGHIVQTETDTWLAGTPCSPGRRNLRLLCAMEALV